ncbi:ATP-dependent helicase [Comamonas sp. CMM01]|uniref:UvrD-helicase domain-containing protein n=1 Tax=Comamonas sp. CMM01 TaxID=2769280 RepID=UPI001786C795|nr:ATP-dependent helicase [Comamonas sp. CMM01]MBD9532787.1 ATP-dependent helicase [Comamonas sp. CMM01]
MILTEEQQAAVSCQESVFLTACPGSGKTRTITAKLGRCLEEVEGSSRAVACITYTNAAVHEIETRVRRTLSLREVWALDISTIHSFCLNNIFRPHAHKLEQFRQGFKVIGQDSEEFEALVNQTRASHGKRSSSRDVDEFAQLRQDINGTVEGAPILSGNISVAEALEFWRLMYERGFVDFSSILFWSHRLCIDYPEICNYLSARFAWILVDEFQDTTDLQTAIFSEIYRCGNTRFFLVGDLCQSIFGFAGASPALAEAFATEIHARRDFSLSFNFRSSQLVVNDAERIFQRAPPMVAEGRNKYLNLATEYNHAENPTAAVIEHFLPRIQQLGITLGESAVLASSWFKLIPIAKELRRQGIPVLGPGARPYRRQRLFSILAERICGHLCEPDFESLVGVERALYETLLEATNRLPLRLFSYEGRLLVYKILADARHVQENSQLGSEFLYALAARVSERLLSAEYLKVPEVDMLRASVVEMEADMRRNKVDPDSLTVDELGILARPKRALKLLTFHAAKGREFGAVAMVDLNEGSIPFYQARTNEEFEEARRLFYVGLTRAEKYLMYAPDARDYRNRPTRYLGQGYLGLC